MPDEAPEKPVPTGDAAPVPTGNTVATEADGVASAPKRRKKRKKPLPESEAAPVAPKEPALTPDGRERPLFVLGFPTDDPELDRLVHAFEAGNYAFVREHAPKLAERTSSARVRDAARELARRIEPDPLIKVLLALSVALFVVLAFWAYKTHGG